MKEKLVEHFQKTGEFRCFCIAMGVLSFFVWKLSVEFGRKSIFKQTKKASSPVEARTKKK
jgi:hypothetical protein